MIAFYSMNLFSASIDFTVHCISFGQTLLQALRTSGEKPGTGRVTQREGRRQGMMSLSCECDLI